MGDAVVKLVMLSSWILFKIIGAILPESSSSFFGNQAGHFRALLIRPFIDSCGKKVNIDNFDALAV